MQLTEDQFTAIVPLARHKVDIFLVPLNAAMEEFGITDRLDVAAFVATCAHESASFQFMREIASGAAYEGRDDLGNTEPGDGVKFPGRGPIQTTGRANYGDASMKLYGDHRLLVTPELLEQPIDGCRASAYFWHKHNIERYSLVGDFDGVSDAVNRGHKTATVGDSNGWADRLAFYNRCLAELPEDE